MSKILLLVVVFVFTFFNNVIGQTSWLQTYGGTRNEDGQSICLDMKGGYTLIGNSESNDVDFLLRNKGRNDVVVINFNNKGNILWKKNYGGSTNDFGKQILPNGYGGYLLFGSSSSNDGDFSGINKGNSDIFVINIDSSGSVKWKKTFGGSESEGFQSVIKTNDNGYIIAGGTSSSDGDLEGLGIKGGVDILLLKIDQNGNLLWRKSIGGSKSEGAFSITLANDGELVITGFTNSFDGDFIGLGQDNQTDVFVIKLNLNGNIVWKKTFGGYSSDKGWSIVSTKDNGILVTGETWSMEGSLGGVANKGYSDIFLIKLNNEGNILWVRGYGGSGFDCAYSVATTRDDEIILTGYTTSNDQWFSNLNKGEYDIMILKISKNGEYIWRKTYGGSKNDYGLSLVTTMDGILLTGFTNSDDKDFVNKRSDSSDIFIMKLDDNGNPKNTTSINEFSEPTTTLTVHPNPFSNSTTVSYKVETPSNVRIELLNTLGQTIEVLREDYTDIGTYQLPINVSTLSSGLYSVRIRSGSMNEVVPVWVVR